MHVQCSIVKRRIITLSFVIFCGQQLVTCLQHGSAQDFAVAMSKTIRTRIGKRPVCPPHRYTETYVPQMCVCVCERVCAQHSSIKRLYTYIYIYLSLSHCKGAAQVYISQTSVVMAMKPRFRIDLDLGPHHSSCRMLRGLALVWASLEFGRKQWHGGGITPGCWWSLPATPCHSMPSFGCLQASLSLSDSGTANWEKKTASKRERERERSK